MSLFAGYPPMFSHCIQFKSWVHKLAYQALCNQVQWPNWFHLLLPHLTSFLSLPQSALPTPDPLLFLKYASTLLPEVSCIALILDTWSSALNILMACSLVAFSLSRCHRNKAFPSLLHLKIAILPPPCMF